MSEDDEEPVRSDEDVPDVDEPAEPGAEGELMVSELEVPGRVELAPEPAPEPMLPEVVSPREDEDDVPLPALSFHFVNSVCDSEPSLLVSAVEKPLLSSLCIAASVCEMRPSRLASSELNVGVALPVALEELWPIELLLWPIWLELLLWPEGELPGAVLLWAKAAEANTAAATALAIAVLFMICPRMLKLRSTQPCSPLPPEVGMSRNSDSQKDGAFSAA